MGGQTEVHNDKQSGKPPAVGDDLVHTVDQKICERWHFTISDLLCQFPQISCTFLSMRLLQLG
jgi:hypothetical protein